MKYFPVAIHFQKGYEIKGRVNAFNSVTKNREYNLNEYTSTFENAYEISYHWILTDIR